MIFTFADLEPRRRAEMALRQDISDRKRTELDLIAAIEGAMQDSIWLSQEIMDRLAALRAPAEPSVSSRLGVELTPRERDVLGLIAKGKSDEAIADALSLKCNTVRNHVARLYAKGPQPGPSDRLGARSWPSSRHARPIKCAMGTRAPMPGCVRIFGSLEDHIRLISGGVVRPFVGDQHVHHRLVILGLIAGFITESRL